MACSSVLPGRRPCPGEHLLARTSETRGVVLETMYFWICGTDWVEYLSGHHNLPVDIANPLTGRTAARPLGDGVSGRRDACTS